MELTTGVRPMNIRDVEQVVRLEKTCFSESWSENLIVSGLDSRLDTYFVYEDNGRVSGYSVLRILADEGEIQRIAVNPESRRRGIGRKLMDAMMNYSRKRGVTAIALEVRESNVGARHLYDSYGFVQEAVRKAYYSSPTEDAVIMWNRRLQNMQ